MTTLTPKNWSAFQHYKNRSPAWIKLHRGLLDDYQFSQLPLASRALAPLLWLLASEYEGGKIIATFAEIAFRLRMAEAELVDAVKPLIDAGFFVSDSKPLACRKRIAIPEVETEVETEREEEKILRAVATATRPMQTDPFDEFWRAYPKREGANPKAPARKKFTAACKSGCDPGAIIAAAKRYAGELRTQGKIGTPYVAQAMTWLNQQRFDDYKPPPASAANVAPPGAPSDEELRKRYGPQSSSSDQANGAAANGRTHSGADNAEKLRSASADVRASVEPRSIPDD